MQKTTYTTAGIEGVVELLIDEWGVPHIFAGNASDTFFAQGFNVARDRLWQIDLWRRKGLGLLSEVFGEKFLRRDRAARLFLYRGDMDAEWSSYGAKGKEIVTSFVEGINCYIGLIEAGKAEMPAEFLSMGYEPARWAPDDVVRIRTHGVFGNLREEVARAQTITAFGERVEDLRKVREPARNIRIPDRGALEAVTADVLRDFDLATKPIDFTTEDTLPPPNSFYKDGSNNWVISHRRSETGRPVLANDPHRVASVIPGLRYICHLSCPEFDVIGGGEPCIPGVSIGHNGHIAFGLTTFSLDQEDLLVLELNPDNRSQYRCDDGWLELRAVPELVPVKGADAYPINLQFSRFGPVLLLDEDRNLAFALRAAWLEPGMAPYLKSIDSMMHTEVEDFVAALHGWGAPPLNMVYADTKGTIGWQVVGKAPMRNGWDGIVPVPGNGSHDWVGFRQGAELPRIENPASGYIATANEMNVPPEHMALELGFDWFAPYRRERIGEVLGGSGSIPFEASPALQTDWKSIPAARILGMLRNYYPNDDLWNGAGFALLADWDFVLAPDSAAACLFEVWYRRYFRVALRRAALSSYASCEDPDAIWPQLMPAEELLADARMEISILESAETLLGSDWPQTLRTVAVSSMQEALEFLANRLGPDKAQWQWGKLHTGRMNHPLAATVPELSERGLLGPVPRGGSGDTVCDTAYDTNHVQTGGSTFRVVVDVGAWDNSLAMNAPGQSGEFGSPHFADLFERWAAGEMFPLLYSRDRILPHVLQWIELHPAAQRRQGTAT